MSPEATSQLDRLLPMPLTTVVAEIVIEAPAEMVRKAIWTADVSGSPFIKMLFGLRVLPNLIADLVTGKGLPRGPMPSKVTFVDAIEQGGWVPLSEHEAHGSYEYTAGLIGQFWKPVLRYESFDPADFREWNRPGFAKTAISFRVTPLGEGRCRLTYECRTGATSCGARFWFRCYWLAVGPFVKLIMRDAVQAMRQEAEGRRAAMGTASPLLIDHYAPTLAFPHHIERVVHADSATTYRAIWETDMARSWPVQFLVRLRSVPIGLLRGLQGLPQEPKVAASARLGDLIGPYWTLLAENPGREVVLGMVGEIWRPDGRHLEVPAEDFAAFDTPGYCKVIWAHRVLPLANGSSLLITEARTIATDTVARHGFERYWALLGPFAYFTKWAVLGLMKAKAERRGALVGTSAFA